MIKNIIFDLAGVILNLDIERDTKALNQVGLPDFMGCLAEPAIAEPMVAYLNGLKSEEDFCHELRPSCLPGITDEEMLWSMDAVLADIPASRLQMLARLKQKYNIYLLSNIYDKAWKHAVKEVEQNGFSLDQCFDRLFLSHEMQLAKPDPRIFHAVISETELIPEETIYLDDTRENIEMGNSLGFKSILVPMNRLEEVEFL